MVYAAVVLAGRIGKLVSLQRRSDKQYLKERSFRLFVPLLAGTLLIVPPQGYFALKARGGEPGNYLDFLLDYFPDFSDLSGYSGSFTPAHLWFILYLFVFSLIALPMFRRFAVTGFLACMHPNLSDMFARCRLHALLALLVTVPAWLWMMDHFHGAADFSAIDILLTLLRTLNVWLTLIVIAGYGSKLLNFRHSWLDYANEAAFPIYVIHQTVIVAIGYDVVQFEWNLYIKFVVILIFSFAASCFLYDGVIRRIAVLRWLFGIKRSHR